MHQDRAIEEVEGPADLQVLHEDNRLSNMIFTLLDNDEASTTVSFWITIHCQALTSIWIKPRIKEHSHYGITTFDQQ